MEQNGVIKAEASTERLMKVLLQGDLAGLNPNEKEQYYRAVCESLGLNPLTKPFEYLKFNGKEILYAAKNCAEQLRQLHDISIEIVSREKIGEDLLLVTARAKNKEGRTDESIGALDVKGLTGQNLGIAMMKAETKAKRRVTLSICGLGMLDESEIGTLKETGNWQEVGVVEAAAIPAPTKPTTYNLAKLPAEHRDAAVTLLRQAGAKTDDELLLYWESPTEIKKLANYKVGEAVAV